MSSPKPLSLCAVVLLSACINLPDVERPQDPPDSGSPPSLTLTLVSPSGTTHTNGTVSVQLEVQGDTPEQVELLVNGQPLTTLVAPYTFNWNTSAVAEGTHQLAARARIGDKTFTSDTREVVVDRTPPQVVSRAPTPGAQDVWVRQPIEATFSEPLNPGTLTSDSVKLAVSGAEAASTSSLSADGKTLTVTPSMRLTVPNSLHLTLTVAVTDLAGNQLVTPGDSWTWSLPTSFPMGGLSAVPGTTNAYQPFLQLSSQGNPFVVWSEESGSGKFNVYASRWSDNAWEPLGGAINAIPYGQTLPTLRASLLHMLRLDSENNPIVAWIHPDGSEPGIYVKQWSNNQWISIGNPLNAFPGSSFLPTSLSLDVSTQNKPVIAWEQQNETTRTIFLHAWRWTGQNWMEFGSPLAMARQSTGYARPAIALDRANNPVVAWADYSSDRSFDGINVRRWTGSSWEALGIAVDANPAPSTEVFNTRLILDASDNPVIAWSETDGTAYNIHVHRWAGTDWEPLGSPLSAVQGETHAGSPDLTIDEHGRIFIIWSEEVADRSSSDVHIRKWAGVAWETIGAPMAQTNSTASLSVDTSGRPFMAWAINDSTSSVAAVRIHRYNH